MGPRNRLLWGKGRNVGSVDTRIVHTRILSRKRGRMERDAGGLESAGRCITERERASG